MINDYMGNEAQEFMRQRALQAQMAMAQPRQAAAPAAPVDPAPGLSVPPPANPATPEPQEQAPAPSVGPDTSKWNTDGYSTPKQIRAGASQAAPPGWDQAKWNNPDHQTPKYVVGRILSNYADNPEGLKAAMADIQAAYPGTRLVNDKDKIEIPGVGVIDVGTSFSAGGGKGWRWGANDKPSDGGGASAGGGALGAGGSFNPFSDLGGMTSESTYSKLMRRMSQNTPELLDQQAIMSLLTK
jgi:hypothetical protein